MADGTPVTATLGNGGLTPSVLGAVRSGWHLMPPYDGRVSGRAVCCFRRGVASSETGTIRPARGYVRYPRARRRRFASPRVGSLPSSEAETRGAVEGLDGSPRARRRSPRGSEGGCEWAACWVFLSPFLSSSLEGGRWPSWAQLPNMCLRFLE